MKRSLPSIVAGVAIVLILVLHMVTYQVRYNEVAVVKTFGKITPPDEKHQSPNVKNKPGLYLKWPWPIQRVAILDNRIQLTETVGEETPTRDRKNVIVTTAIGWSIADAYQFNKTFGQDMKKAEQTLQDRVRNDQKTVIAKYDFANFVSTDPKELKYNDIEASISQTLEKVSPSVGDLYGIEIRYVGIESLALPKRITETVFNAMKEERNAEAARYTSAGESEANRIRAEAESIAQTILAFADRKGDQIVAEGKARAAAYNETFKKDEELAVFLLETDYLGKILKDRSTVILEAQPPFDLLKEASQPRGAGPVTPPSGRAPSPEIVKPK
jgi:modulator of FtsH protease HflC